MPKRFDLDPLGAVVIVGSLGREGGGGSRQCAELPSCSRAQVQCLGSGCQTQSYTFKAQNPQLPNPKPGMSSKPKALNPSRHLRRCAAVGGGVLPQFPVGEGLAAPNRAAVEV